MKAILQRLRKEAVTVILALIGMAIQLPAIILDWSATPYLYVIVGVCTVVLLLLALFFLLWRRDTKVGWSWEEPLLTEVLNRERQEFTPCRRHFTARSQGRALGCAVGPNLISAIKHITGEAGAKGLELLQESDFDIKHISLHAVNVGGLYHTVSLINSSAWVEHLRVISRHRTDDDSTIDERAKDLLRDIQLFQDCVKHQACDPLEKLLENALKSRCAPGDIKDEFREVGGFLVGLVSPWLMHVFQNAHQLGESLRMHWTRNYNLRRDHCLCAPQNDS